jgi:hypothetical protein
LKVREGRRGKKKRDDKKGNETKERIKGRDGMGWDVMEGKKK